MSSVPISMVRYESLSGNALITEAGTRWPIFSMGHRAPLSGPRERLGYSFSILGRCLDTHFEQVQEAAVSSGLGPGKAIEFSDGFLIERQFNLGRHDSLHSPASQKPACIPSSDC